MVTQLTVTPTLPPAPAASPPSQQSFVQRLIEVSIKLASNTQTNQPNTFAGSSSNTVTISAARTEVRIDNSGAPSNSKATVSLYGLTLEKMNQLTTLGLAFTVIPRNTITIKAGDAQSGMSIVFAGTILQSYGEFNKAPNVPFVFECQSGIADAVVPATVSSFKGSKDVATIMSGFARAMNLGFENNGVSVQLMNPVYAGNILTQMKACARDARINAEIINGNVLAIWPKGSSRNPAAQIPLISKETGMIGYPGFTPQGIIVSTVFNPLIAFGGLVQVRSILKPVTDVGTWAVYKLDHALDSMVPKGDWKSTIFAYNPKFPRPIPPGATS